MTIEVSSTVNERRRAVAALKAKIRRLIQDGHGFVRGTLSERERVCGTATCKCMTGGSKHAGLYLMQTRNGKVKQLYVPAQWADDVRQWVTNYRIVQELLDELSELWWQNIRSREI